MPGLYDRLMDQIGDNDDDANDKPTGGLTPLDIAALPGDQRKVMMLLLREPGSDGLTLDVLRQKLPDVKDLPDILAELADKDWLIVKGRPPNASYKVNLRRKRGSKLVSGIWSSLSDRLDDDG
ncbi:MAG: hypothetical protein JXJ20_03835 [Anaerolineae bacterium]|jgi:hypothetical protein|nr:hypothetical protein [Anaerolineae bacterium]